MNATAQKELRQLGYEHGKEWREGLATKGQLVRLGRFVNEVDFEEWFYATEQRSGPPAEILVFLIDPAMDLSDPYSSHVIAEFWEQVNGGDGDLDDPDYLAGFCEGATEVPAKEKGKK